MKIERQSGEQIVINHHIYFWNGETFVKPSKLKKQLKAANKLLKKQSSKFQWNVEGRIQGSAISASTWREYFGERGIEPMPTIAGSAVINNPDGTRTVEDVYQRADGTIVTRGRGLREQIRPENWEVRHATPTDSYILAHDAATQASEELVLPELNSQPTSQDVEANQMPTTEGRITLGDSFYFDEELMRRMREHQAVLESRMAQALYGTQPNGNNN